MFLLSHPILIPPGGIKRAEESLALCACIHNDSMPCSHLKWRQSSVPPYSPGWYKESRGITGTVCMYTQRFHALLIPEVEAVPVFLLSHPILIPPGGIKRAEETLALCACIHNDSMPCSHLKWRQCQCFFCFNSPGWSACRRNTGAVCMCIYNDSMPYSHLKWRQYQCFI